MNESSDKYRGWMMAVTFDEAGEWEVAREMIPPSTPKSRLGYLQKAFMAVAFAEGGLHEEAIRIMDEQPRRHHHSIEDFLEATGLRGVSVTYAVVSVRAS
ncbi:MAG: hypothetical protein M8357_05485 [Desulfobulbaceae bacterium]|nr:hypothetical protein [Desulfobulbaceae bacterium]